MSHHPLLRLFTPLLFLSLLVAGSVNGAPSRERWYDVEVMLFVQKSQNYRESEIWPLDYRLPDLENARELVDTAATSQNPANPVAFRRLAADELRLSEDAQRIEKAPDLELLSHFGWRQPGLPPDRAVAVRVALPAMPQATAAQDAETEDGALLQQPMAEPPRLEGTLRLILSRYLHIEADLLYREPLLEETERTGGDPFDGMQANSASPESTAAGQQDLFLLAEQVGEIDQSPLYHVYRMQQSRRMRSGELHYLDHPVFGLAVRVTPYEPPAEPGAEATAD